MKDPLKSWRRHMEQFQSETEHESISEPTGDT